MKLEYSVISLDDIDAKPRFAEKLRGYLGNKYRDIDILHNHSDNKYLYRYPLVQYKVIKNKLLVVGVKEGASTLLKLLINEDDIFLEDKQIEVYQKTISKNVVDYGVVQDYISYKFETPWIALNQKNINQYNDGNNIEKEELLKKVLIGNIISMSKGLNYTVENKIHVWVDLKEKDVKLKGIKHKAFIGNFKVNFKLPDYIGLGKSVSRGFGTIKNI